MITTNKNVPKARANSSKPRHKGLSTQKKTAKW